MSDTPPPAHPCLRPREPLGPGILRVATELLDGVLHHINEGSDDRSEDIHKVRTGLKRTRALVRLVRPAMTKRTAAAELTVFRDAGRHFASARDGYILVHTLETLSEPGTLTPALRTTIATLREANRETVDHILDETDPASAAVIVALRAARQRWATGTGSILAGGVEPDEVVAGLRATYHRGRKALRRARDDTTAATLHEWRKRVKDLRYQIEIIGPVAVEVAHFHEPLVSLSDVLGEDHDLSELKAAVDSGLVDGTGADAVLSGLARRRAELEQRAWSLGSAIYRAKPDRFVAHLAGLPAAR